MKQFEVHIAELPSNSSEAAEDFFSSFSPESNSGHESADIKAPVFLICTKDFLKKIRANLEMLNREFESDEVILYVPFIGLC